MSATGFIVSPNFVIGLTTISTYAQYHTTAISTYTYQSMCPPVPHVVHVRRGTTWHGMGGGAPRWYQNRNAEKALCVVMCDVSC